jgi:hypothetical protein
MTVSVEARRLADLRVHLHLCGTVWEYFEDPFMDTGPQFSPPYAEEQ